MARKFPIWIVAGAGIAGLALLGLGGAAIAMSWGGGGVSREGARISSAYKLHPALGEGIADVARSVGTHPYWLADLIHHETAYTFDPAAQHGGSKAIGWLQWTPKTLQRLSKATGQTITTEIMRNLSALEQLAWARYYLDWTAAGQHPDDPRAIPLDTPQRLFMSVFFPPARDADPNAPFAAIDHPLADRVTANNPTIRTPNDYIQEVLSAGKLSGLVAQGGING